MLKSSIDYHADASYRVAKLEETIGLERQATVDELLWTVLNREDVDRLIPQSVRFLVDEKPDVLTDPSRISLWLLFM